MMPEISLNILDIAQNSIKADASLIEISCTVNSSADTLSVTIKDNGCGMSKEQLEKVTDPFYTSRTTRRVGLGVPFFKLAAELSGGSFDIHSELNTGTVVTAVFGLSNLNRMPLGDISATIHTLILYNSLTEFVFTYMVDNKSFTLDTREIKEILGSSEINTPEISQFIMDFLCENKKEVDCGLVC